MGKAHPEGGCAFWIMMCMRRGMTFFGGLRAAAGGMGMGERGRQTSLALLWKADDPVRSPWLDKLNAPLAESGARTGIKKLTVFLPARVPASVTTRVRRCKQVLLRAILLSSRRENRRAIPVLPYMTYLLRACAPMAVLPNSCAVSVISLRSQCRPRRV